MNVTGWPYAIAVDGDVSAGAGGKLTIEFTTAPADEVVVQVTFAVESFADPFPSTPRMTSQDDPFGTHPPLLGLSGARLYQKSCPPSRSHFQGVNTPRGRSREKTTKRSSSAFTSSCEARRASLLHFSAPSSPGQKILSNTKDVHRQGMPLVACQRSATRHQ